MKEAGQLCTAAVDKASIRASTRQCITCALAFLQGGMMPGMGRPPMMNNYNNYGNYGNNNYGNYGMPPMMQQPQPPMYGGPGRGGMGPRGRGQPAGRMVGSSASLSYSQNL